MNKNLIFSYFLEELIFPIFLSLIVIVSVLMMQQLYQIIPFLQITGLKFNYLFLMIFYSLLPTFAMAVPISVLVGVYYGIHRLSMDHEVVAIRAAGVSLFFLFRPVLFISFLCALLLGLMTNFISPWGVMELNKLQYNLIKSHTRVNLTVGKVNNFFNQKMIYLDSQKGELFQGILIASWDSKKDDTIIEAESGKIYFDEENRKITFLLYNGKIHTPTETGYRIAEYQQLDYVLPPPTSDKDSLPKRFQQLGNKKAKKIDYEMYYQELVNAIKTEDDPKVKREYLDELHARIVTIFCPFAFAIFALPLGLTDPRNPKSTSFITMLLFMIIYFGLYSQGRSLFVQGQSSVLSLYMPLLFTLVAGVIFFAKINYDLQTFKDLFKFLKRSKRKI
ncbi:MAG: LptF/LptG family permease [SAR324 cluster bacterium]|nr:LptF/LptG family permease [SAR324 cluster bacterium]